MSEPDDNKQPSRHDIGTRRQQQAGISGKGAGMTAESRTASKRGTTLTGSAAQASSATQINSVAQKSSTTQVNSVAPRRQGAQITTTTRASAGVKSGAVSLRPGRRPTQASSAAQAGSIASISAVSEGKKARTPRAKDAAAQTAPARRARSRSQTDQSGSAGTAPAGFLDLVMRRLNAPRRQQPTGTAKKNRRFIIAARRLTAFAHRLISAAAEGLAARYDAVIPVSVIGGLIGMLAGTLPAAVWVLLFGSSFPPLYALMPLLIWLAIKAFKGLTGRGGVITTAVFSLFGLYLTLLSCQAADHILRFRMSVFDLPLVTAAMIGRRGMLPGPVLSSAIVYPVIFTALGLFLAYELFMHGAHSAPSMHSTHGVLGEKNARTSRGDYQSPAVLQQPRYQRVL